MHANATYSIGKKWCTYYILVSCVLMLFMRWWLPQIEIRIKYFSFPDIFTITSLLYVAVSAVNNLQKRVPGWKGSHIFLEHWSEKHISPNNNSFLFRYLNVFISFFRCRAEHIILKRRSGKESTGCKPDVSSQVLLFWREQKSLSRDFVLSKKYFLAGIRWAYDRLLFHHFPEWTDARQRDCLCQSKKSMMYIVFQLADRDFWDTSCLRRVRG